MLNKSVLIFLLFSSTIIAGEIDVSHFSSSLDYAQVVNVQASQQAGGSWCFNTTVQHNDQGWKHYADGWEVVDLQGNRLAYRLLAHPHDHEQPFTRGQCNIQIPDNLFKVIVRARCQVHGYGGKGVIVDLTQAKGDGYSVSRRD